MTYSKRLVHRTDLETYMRQHGYVLTRTTSKRTFWEKGGQMLSAKKTRDWLEKNGPNNGYMRVFMHDVAIKLQEHNPKYGWDDSLVDALFDGVSLVLVNKRYDEQWQVNV